MRQWAPIAVADALELLSPDFKNDEVRAHAVSVLQRKEDDELLYYLLQLVQVRGLGGGGASSWCRWGAGGGGVEGTREGCQQLLQAGRGGRIAAGRVPSSWRRWGWGWAAAGAGSGGTCVLGRGSRRQQ